MKTSSTVNVSDILDWKNLDEGSEAPKGKRQKSMQANVL